MRSAIVLVALALGACATANANDAAPSSGKCSTDKLGAFVGRDATSDTAAELVRESGAKVLRWAPKGSMLTMDFREDRLTVHLDANNKIERLDCV
ncbi:hypothetical protein GCM10023264_29950 [Sphingomonas daechungensis]|uniref:Peptidase inhibitor I78 n=1 Tax=Sphingomonas daechungensis TaxID=1176646 RepID=A0ABX6SZY0_9SPHN|nr:I78 family peptidase inhibitor [Sphingomonas daechungensis]QNP42523.1 peptidase inhibitor I78 [Sphingomonas daechungensis]